VPITLTDMPLNGNTDTAGGIFESADVPGPVLAQRIDHGEVVKIIGSDRFKQLRAAAKQRERAMSASQGRVRRAADAAL
jgi:hypothetical protein